jgi:hypothetical protein
MEKPPAPASKSKEEEEFVKDINEALDDPKITETQRNEIRHIVKLYNTNNFHNFKSKHPMPKTLLWAYLKDAGLDAMAKKIDDDKYDF